MTLLLSLAFTAYGLNYFLFTSGAGSDITLSRLFNIFIFFLFLLSFYFSTSSDAKKTFSLFANLSPVKTYFLIVFVISINGFILLFSNLSSEIVDRRRILDFLSYVESFIPFLILPTLILRYCRISRFALYLRYFLYLIVFIGLVDYVASFVFASNSFIPRHILDGSLIESARFHSLIGEPRHVGAWLSMMTFSIILLSPQFNYRQFFIIISLFLLPIPLTQSATLVATFIVTIPIFIFSLVIHSLLKLKLRRPPIISLLLSVLLVSSFVITFSSDRVTMYLSDLDSLSYNLQSATSQLSYLQSKFASNIIPIIEFTKDLINFDFYHLLFGHGISSSGFLHVILESQPNYPNSAFSRIIYEFGLIGLGLFSYLYYNSYLLLASILESSSDLRRICLNFLFCFSFSSYLVDINNCYFALLGVLCIGAFSKRYNRVPLTSNNFTRTT